MLVERTGKDGRGEFLVPSPLIPVIAGILFFLSFLSYDIIDFPKASEGSPTAWHLLRWHVVVWMGLGSMFWAGMKLYMGKEGLLSGKVGSLLSKLVLKFPALVEKKIIFDPSGKTVILSTKRGEERVEATEGGRLTIEWEAPPSREGTSSSSNSGISFRIDYQDKEGNAFPLHRTRHYASARRLAERAAKTLRVPLKDLKTEEERSPDELDRPLWEIPVSRPESLPWAKNKKEWGFRRTPDGFRGTLELTIHNTIGFFICAALLVGYFALLLRLEEAFLPLPLDDQHHRPGSGKIR